MQTFPIGGVYNRLVAGAQENANGGSIESINRAGRGEGEKVIVDGLECAMKTGKDSAPTAALITFLSALSLASRPSNGVSFLRDLMASEQQPVPIERKGKIVGTVVTRWKEFPLMVNHGVTS